MDRESLAVKLGHLEKIKLVALAHELKDVPHSQHISTVALI